MESNPGPSTHSIISQPDTVKACKVPDADEPAKRPDVIDETVKKAMGFQASSYSSWLPMIAPPPIFAETAREPIWSYQDPVREKERSIMERKKPSQSYYTKRNFKKSYK